ncbi:hypothetical protein [Aeromicrobium marinum]|uniref:hypothetical protein n=1 Tax=Aeromicrobium marinum TaxID=219314 RepID=UPI00058CF70B|nr:hypothetical protein [Aeromicrobium marinum]
MKRLTSLLSGVGLVAAAVMFTAPAAQAATTGPNFIETSHVAECGSITISLRNVSPWIYPVSVSTDGSEPNAAGPLYGPVVDNRTDGGVSGPQRDQTGSRTYSFEEGAGGGTVIVKYVVAAGTESDLYDDQPVGEVTTVEVDTDCAEPNSLETSHVAECGSITISLRNVSPWIYPVSVSTDGSEPNAAGPLYGPVVDNRTDGGVSGPQRDQTGSRTYSFEEDAGDGTVIVKYVVAAGTESDLYDDQPVGEVTTVEVDTDCAGPGTGDGGAGAGAGGGAGGGTGTDTPAGAPTGVLPAVGSAITGPLGPIGLAMVAAGSLLLWLNRSRLRGGRHSAV